MNPVRDWEGGGGTRQANPPQKFIPPTPWNFQGKLLNTYLQPTQLTPHLRQRGGVLDRSMYCFCEVKFIYFGYPPRGGGGNQ